jgi:tetratricopeptide (TPR) repeat protein
MNGLTAKVSLASRSFDDFLRGSQPKEAGVDEQSGAGRDRPMRLARELSGFVLTVMCVLFPVNYTQAVQSDRPLMVLEELDSSDTRSIPSDSLIAQCTKALNQKRELPQTAQVRLYIARGRAYCDLERFEEANRDAQAALRLRPTEVRAFEVKAYALAGAAISSDRYAGELRTLVENNSRLAAVHDAIARYHFARADFNDCVAACDRAIAIDSDEPSYYFLRGLAKSGSCTTPASIDDLSKAIELGYGAGCDRAAQPYLARAMLRLELDKVEGALRDFQLAAQLDGAIRRTCELGLWTVYFNTGRVHMATHLIDMLTATGVERNTLLSAQAANQIVAGQISDAIRIASKASAARPTDWDGYWWLGNAYFAKGEYKEALRCYDRALEVSPDQLSVLCSKAYLLASCPAAEFRNGSEARKLATECCKRTSYLAPRPLMIAAIADAECGNTAAAAQTAKKSLDVARRNFHLREEYERRRRLFEQGKTYRFDPKAGCFDYLYP